MSYEESYPSVVSYNQYEELQQEYDHLEEKYKDVDFKLEELKIALKEVFEARTGTERLDKIEDFYEWCKENQYV